MVRVHVLRGQGRAFGFTLDEQGTNLPRVRVPLSLFRGEDKRTIQAQFDERRVPTRCSTSDQGTPLCRREITQLSGTKGSLRDNHR